MELISIFLGAPTQISHSLPSASALTFALLLIFQFIILPICRAWTSPLRHLPGPKLTLFTQNYITLLDFFCLRTSTLYEWHLKYGPILRVGPNEVSFTSPTAIKQIYQDPAMEKYPRLYGLFKHFGIDSAFGSITRLQHGWRRKGVAASLSWSRVLERENTDRLVGSIVGRYLEVIERNSKHYNVGQGHPDGKLVDVYLLNNWFAADVATGFFFGRHRGSKTLCFNIEDAEGSWWEKPSYHRKIIEEYHESTLRSHVYLWVEFPKFMRLVDWLASIWKFTSKKFQIMLRRIHHDNPPEDSKVFKMGIDRWSWKTWESVKNEDPQSREDSNSLCVAEILAKLVRDSPSGRGDGKFEEGIWTDNVAATELTVSLHIDPQPL